MRSTRALIASTSARVSSPERDAALVRHHRRRDAGGAQAIQRERARPASARRAPDRGCTERRRPACRRGRTARPAATAAARAPRRRAARAGAHSRARGGTPPRTGSRPTSRASCRDLARRARTRRDAPPGEAGCLRGPRAREQRAERAACARRTRPARARGRHDGRRVRAERAARRRRARAPIAPVQRVHQHVVRVAGLQAHADVPARRRAPGCVTRRAPRTMRLPRATMRSARSASSRYARGNARRSRRPPAGPRAGTRSPQ